MTTYGMLNVEEKQRHLLGRAKARLALSITYREEYEACGATNGPNAAVAIKHAKMHWDDAKSLFAQAIALGQTINN